MNRGLKSYTRQHKQVIGNAGTAYVNLNENDANMHMMLPLIKAVGDIPIELNLIYDHQNRNVVDKYVGKGFKLSFMSDFSFNSDEIIVKNADGSSDAYRSGVFNKETKLTLTKESDNSMVTAEDKYGNIRLHKLYKPHFTSLYQTKKGLIIDTEFTASGGTIKSNRGDIITFTRNSDGYIAKIVYTCNGKEVSLVNISYISGKIKLLEYMNSSSVFAKTSIEYNTTLSFITLKDEITGESLKIQYSGNKVTALTDNAGRKTIFSYNGKRTTVTDYKNSKSHTFFDNNNLPRYVVDDSFNVVGLDFDNMSKNILSKSQPIQMKNKELNIFTESLRNFVKSGITFSEESFSDDIFNEMIGKSIFHIKGTGTLTKEISEKGLATDQLTLAMFGKLLSGSATVELTTLKETALAEFKNNKEFDFVSFGIDVQKSFTKLKITIKFTDADIYLGDMSVIKKHFGSLFQYDENGNIIRIISKGTTEMSYDENNMLSRSIGIDSTIVGCAYDSKGNLIKAVTANGLQLDCEYDGYNNPTTTKLTDRNGKKYITTKEYDSTHRFVSNETDQFGNSTSIEYTNAGKIKNVIDALGVIMQVTYKDNDLIERLVTKKDSLNAEASYTYNNKRLLETVMLSNGSKYKFNYNSQNWLTEVKLNDQTIFTYEYDEKTGNILSQTYGKGDCFKFKYRTDGLVETVSYLSSDTEEIRYTYSYDTQKRLVSVEDSEKIYKCTYTYDSEGRVSKTVTNDAKISYAYDNLGNINNMASEREGLRVYQAFDTVQRSQYVHPELLFRPFIGENYSAFFEVDGNLRSDNSEIKPVNSVSTRRDDRMPCVRLDNSSRLIYKFDVKQQESDDAGCLMFWFKIDNIAQYSRFFYYGYNSEKNVIAAEVDNKKIKVWAIDNDNKNKEMFTSGELKQGWNFFALTFRTRNDGPGYGDEFSCYMTLNDQTQESVTSLKMRFGNAPNFAIGNIAGLTNYCMYGYAAALLMTPRKYMSADEIKKYYLCSKDFIMDNRFIDEEVQTVDFGQASVYTVNSNIQSRFEICPLRNSVVSLTGKRPEEFDVRRTSSTDRDKSFNFNQQIKGYAYVADGSMLKYDFGQSTSGTIMMRAFTDSLLTKQYLFDCIDDSGKTIGLYRGEDLYLYVDCNGKLIKTSLSFTNNEWHTVGLSFAVESAVYGSSGVLSLRVYLDGQVYNAQTGLVSFGSLKVVVGGKTEQVGKLTCALNGQIEMLAANTVFNEFTTLQSLEKELSVLTKSNEYDGFGLIKKKEIHKDGKTTILSHTYDYKNGSNSISELIRREDIEYGKRKKRTRLYEYDATGRLEYIEESGDCLEYRYDYRGFLSSVYKGSTESGAYVTTLIESFEHDGNGNITKYNDMDFTYDSTIKDKLIKYGNQSITYENTLSLNPITWGVKSFSYEGRRLVSFRPNKVARYAYVYSYDEQGHRIRKKHGNDITYYSYSDDRLIIEDGPDGMLTFLYDENGQLYGFIKDSAKYYYIIDITGTILGIVNESGTLVAQYSYSAFGKCEIILDTDRIATINPFRYKCYYYDTESHMYYCQSRYYVPEWGRWLNADSINFLKFEDLNGTNLFEYCTNSPLIYVDPKGHFGLLVGLVLIVAAASPLIFVSGHKKTIGDSDITESDVNINGNNPDGSIEVKITESGIEIINSYKIDNINDQYKILQIIMQSQEYQKYNYSRNIYDYLSEWRVHNIAYNLHFMRDHSDNVFLNREFNGFKERCEHFIYMLYLSINF